MAPTRESLTRVYNTNLNATQHTSVHSHMMPFSLPATRLNLVPRVAGYNPDSNQVAEDNTQARFELFLLGEGEKKVTEEADTRESSFSSPSEAAKTRCFYINFSITRNDLDCLCQVPRPSFPDFQFIFLPYIGQAINPFSNL